MNLLKPSSRKFISIWQTALSKNVCIDKLDDIVNEYNNTYDKTIKMKPVDVKSGTYLEYNVNSNDRDPKF